MPLLLGGELEVGVGVLLLWSLPAAENWDTKERTVETEIKSRGQLMHGVGRSKVGCVGMPGDRYEFIRSVADLAEGFDVIALEFKGRCCFAANEVRRHSFVCLKVE